jgi:hypothetical protein
MIDISTIPNQNPEVLSRMADDEAVLVMPQHGKVKVLNEVGAAIWKLIDGKRNIQMISEKICAQFDVDQSTAEKDTLAFVADLLDREIITTSAS